MRKCYCDNCPKGSPFEGNKGYCYECWRYHNVASYHEACGGQEKTILEKAASFAAASIKHALSGFSTVSDEVYAERIKICEFCDQNKNWECLKCGCSISIKSRWMSQTCPLEKWPVLENVGTGKCGSCGKKREG